ncbi:MAG: glutamine-synthetase adenylyltransferase [Bryobacteraceae bacterium]
MERLLDHVDFRDPIRAAEQITRVSQAVSDLVRPKLRFLLASSPDPDEVLHLLERMADQHPDDFARITGTDSGLTSLVAVFSYSRFLSEAVLREPSWMDEILKSGDLDRAIPAEEYERRLDGLLGDAEDVPSPVTLAIFRRKQLLRILLRDVMGLANLAEIVEEISNLADSILEVAYRRIRADLVRRYGVPRCPAEGGELVECNFAIISLGKLGGQGLNYSSDIDLMFLYAGPGETSGPEQIANKEFYKKVANRLTELLSTYTPEGKCYRVDLRLRPDGRLGEICISLDGAREYYSGRARDWELQMLIRARVSAGDRRLGRELLNFVEPLIYASTLDFGAVEAVSATRERITEKLAARRSADLDIKLAPGGIRDIEFLVQCLQRLHGGREPWVRLGGTLRGLSRLYDKGLLSNTEYSHLASAYEFFRALEHRLQFDEDRQTHTLPSDSLELDVLARKMPSAQLGAEPSGQALLGQLNAHLEEVKEIYERVIHAQQPVYYTATPCAGSELPLFEPETLAFTESGTSNLVRFLDQRAPRLAATLSREGLRRGQLHFERFLEAVMQNDEWLEWLDSNPALSGYALDLFDHSPFFSDQLVRTPDLIVELKRLQEEPDKRTPYSEIAFHTVDLDDLRRSFSRAMFRIQAESICLQTPIFETLADTSDLADAVVQAAYRMALQHVLASHPPATSGYKAEGQMVVVALGRLGMREFDLASDADLVFMLPDSEAAELRFWTLVARRIIDIITSYTGYGVMFPVDTRLRPNGRAGALVQLESSYTDYFSAHAEAWEGITYMKSRAVAGDIETGTEFLHALQDVDWRRYGQSGRARKLLAQMRARVEKEQGSGNPLKAGYGGYYDIDFALMYLRLKSAGIFYKVLNTPARIDIVEKMGHLERADADFLRDAAIFYRALDHGLRVSTGHAEGDLPKSQAQLQNLVELISRWTPAHLHDQSLDAEILQIQTRTREFFDRTFAA